MHSQLHITSAADAWALLATVALTGLFLGVFLWREARRERDEPAHDRAAGSGTDQSVRVPVDGAAPPN